MTQTIRVDFGEVGTATRVFDEAFQHPRRRVVIQPVDVAVARAWLRKNARVVNFVWCAGVKNLTQRLAEAGPLRMGQLIDLDTLYGRERCGWVDHEADGDYLCNAPPDKDANVDTETGKRRCFSWNCPIAYEADREDIRRKDPELWRSDYKPYPGLEPNDYMVLHSRPRYAYVPNVTVLGCDGWQDYA